MRKFQPPQPRPVRHLRAEQLRSRVRANVAVAELASESAHQLNNPLEALTNVIYLADSSTKHGQIGWLPAHAAPHDPTWKIKPNGPRWHPIDGRDKSPTNIL